MKKLFFPAIFAALVIVGTTDANAQNRTIGTSSGSQRPIPSNADRTRSGDAQQYTHGRPFEQIRVNETNSDRNRNKPQADIGEDRREVQMRYEQALREREQAIYPASVPEADEYPVEQYPVIDHMYRDPYCPDLDNYLIYLAREQNKTVVGLETDSLQTQYINQARQASWGELKKPIGQWIGNIREAKHTGRYCRAARDYMAYQFDYQLEEKCGNNPMLKGRNELWMQVLPGYFAQNKCFVAVGMLHLFGDCGLIMQLRQRGFVVEPVTLP